MWRSSRLTRKHSFPSLLFFDARHEEKLRDRTSTLNSNLSESATDSRASDNEAADTVCNLRPSVSRLAPAAEADQDLAYFNFGEGANNAPAAQEASD